VAAACNAPASIDLRVNPLRSTVDAVQQALAAAGVSAAPIGDLAQGLVLQGRSGDLRALPGYSEGHWSVQDRSAQRVVALLDPQLGERILDACAAPGGKAIQIAERCCGAAGAPARLWAVDRSEARLRRLQRNAERLGLAAALSLLAADATALPQLRPDWLGTFDRVLLDAPCSGLGTLARHADARWRMTPAAVEELALLQRRLLEALAPLLKPGGRLVYATCTMHPRENSDQIQAFLAAHDGWCLQQQWQRWPGDGDGFYAALLVAPSQGAGGAGTATGGGAVAPEPAGLAAAGGGGGAGVPAPGPLGGPSVGVPSGTGAKVSGSTGAAGVLASPSPPSAGVASSGLAGLASPL